MGQDPDRFQRRSGLTFQLVGPLVGAALLGLFGGGVVALVDSLSFLVAALIIASIPLQGRLPERAEQHWWHKMTDGITHLAHEPVLRHTLVASALLLVVIGAQARRSFR